MLWRRFKKNPMGGPRPGAWTKLLDWPMHCAPLHLMAGWMCAPKPTHSWGWSPRRLAGVAHGVGRPLDFITCSTTVRCAERAPRTSSMSTTYATNVHTRIMFFLLCLFCLVCFVLLCCFMICELWIWVLFGLVCVDCCLDVMLFCVMCLCTKSKK